MSVRGDQVAIDASYCGSCQPVVALVDLSDPTASASTASASAATSKPTREQIAEEAGFERLPSGGWHSGECQIERIYPTKAEVLAARMREERRNGTDGPESGGFVVSTRGDRIGVELELGFSYCQQAIEEALAHVGHGGVPEGSPTTVANARGAIEALGYPIRFEEPAREKNVLVGRVHGRLGERFAFFLFVNRGAPRKMPDVPGYPGFMELGNEGGLAGGGLVEGYIFGSREIPRRGESAAQFKQQSNIELEVEEALCRQATGESCGI
jgi:hypothetical protein